MVELSGLDGADLMVERTADIVTAYVGNHIVPYDDVPRLIADVHAALRDILMSSAAEKLKPAVSVRKSLQEGHLTCLECGASFKSIRRHLMTHHGLSANEYREKWDLPRDYPMVSPSYAEARSVLAKAMGLGRKQNPRRQPANG